MFPTIIYLCDYYEQEVFIMSQLILFGSEITPSAFWRRLKFRTLRGSPALFYLFTRKGAGV